MKLKATAGKVSFTLAIGEGNGRIGHTTMDNIPPDATTIEPEPETPAVPSPAPDTIKLDLPQSGDPEQLEEYRRSVRSRIQGHNSDLFENTSPAHARVIIEEFVRAARETVQIYCGKLSREIYGPLVGTFLNAQVRGVDIRVITEREQAETQELVRILREREAIHRATPRFSRPIPHFILVDGKRYRMEMNDERKRALVCAEGSQEDGTAEAAAEMQRFFTHVWENRSEAYPAEA